MVKRRRAEPFRHRKPQFEGGKDAVTAGGGQFSERIGEGLEIGQGDRGERLPCPATEADDVGPVGALGVHGAAVEPDGNQLIVGMGLRESGHSRASTGAERAISVRIGIILSRKKDKYCLFQGPLARVRRYQSLTIDPGAFRREISRRPKWAGVAFMPVTRDGRKQRGRPTSGTGRSSNGTYRSSRVGNVSFNRVSDCYY
jgi:hypothetical protein